MVTDMARSFAEKELLPHADNWDEHEIFPRETILKAAALGAPRRLITERGLFTSLCIMQGSAASTYRTTSGQA